MAVIADLRCIAACILKDVYATRLYAPVQISGYLDVANVCNSAFIGLNFNVSNYLSLVTAHATQLLCVHEFLGIYTDLCHSKLGYIGPQEN